MDAAFATVVFAEPARAAANLRRIEPRLPASLWPSLPAILAQLPDPDGALNYLERYLRDDPEREIARVHHHLARHPAALHYLLVLFSYSRFLSETLIQQPDLILWLHRPAQPHALAQSKSAEDLLEELARFQATALDQPPGVVLARFKRREYLRIVLRDALGLASLSDTTLELSRLADALLDRALRTCEQKLENAYGVPQYLDAGGRRQTARMTILALGKLGAEELNYSSDVDLMFLYAHDGETSGGSAGTLTNAEYFVRLAQAVLRLLTEVTPEGAVFRVDLRLRPQGGEGDIAVSLPAALAYYRQRAREWELQMLIKARPTVGDIATGRAFLRELRPLIYRPEFNLSAVEAVLNAREEISRELRRPRGAGARPADHAAAWNVKLSPGGIRDIEFLTQCLQRVYGGADPWLAVPSTLVSLQRLHDKGFLSGPDFHRLAAAYEFLRHVEHRLQLRDGLQRHTLPEGPEACDRLARRCHLTAGAAGTPGQELRSRVARHFAEVTDIYERIVRPQARATPAAPSAAPRTSVEPGEVALLRRLKDDFPGLVQVTEEVASHSDPYARRGLSRFLSSAALERELMGHLASHPEWVRRAATLFSGSDLLVEMLARHPDEIAVVADPGLVGFRGPLAAATGDFRQAMGALRLAYRRAVLATLVRALSRHTASPVEPYATLELLTRLAEEALSGALHLAARDVFGALDLAAAPFSVLALGRLGTHEFDIGSDADLVFLVDDGVAPEAREQWRRLAERLVHVVGSHTREGILFPVDTRLRPRGGEGEILQTVGGLVEYFGGAAEGWEAATYLKARPVAGNLALGGDAIARLRGALALRFARDPASAPTLAEQLVHTRARLEKEGVGAKGDFKKAAGGYYDIEYVVAFLALTSGPLGPAPAPAVRQIVALEQAGRLDRAAAQDLRRAALLYRAIDHGVRVVTGRPPHLLPESALAARIENLFRQWKLPVEGSLDAAVARARERTRARYEEIVLGALRAAPGRG